MPAHDAEATGGYEAAILGDVLSPLSTHAVTAIAQNASANVYGVQTTEVPILGIRAMRRSRTKRISATTVATASAQLLPDDANRTGYVLVNLGSNPVFIAIGGEAATSANGIFLSPLGGTLIVEKNRVTVVGPASARPDYSDRNPAQKSDYVGATPGAAARAETTDWTYTVPAARALAFEYGYCHARNDATVAANAIAAARVEYVPNGGALRVMMQALVVTGEASVTRDPAISGKMHMYPGDVVRGITVSVNTAAGSNISLATAFKGTEYDI